MFNEIVGAATGATLTGALGFWGQERANSMNEMIAGQNRDFQRFMSDTAYQRSVKDMRKAGLNPALMFGSAGPSSTPAGASADMKNSLEGFQVNAIEYAKLGEELKILKNTNEKLQSETTKTKKEAEILGKDVEKADFFESLWKFLNKAKKKVPDLQTPANDKLNLLKKQKQETQSSPLG